MLNGLAIEYFDGYEVSKGTYIDGKKEGDWLYAGGIDDWIDEVNESLYFIS